MNSKLLFVSMLLTLGLVTSCDSSNDSRPAPDPVVDETFRVNLVELDVRRISNGDTVTVDTTGVTGEEMTLDK